MTEKIWSKILLIMNYFMGIKPVLAGGGSLAVRIALKALGEKDIYSYTSRVYVSSRI